MGEYLVKRIFGPTLQGEGRRVGRRAMFVRFAGCNVWDGREETREGNACWYCDTDFRGGERLRVEDVVGELERGWSGGREDRLVVLSGGEPLLQVDDRLIDGLLEGGWKVEVETNGLVRPKFYQARITTEGVEGDVDLTVSPKGRVDDMRLEWATVLKLLVGGPACSGKEGLGFWNEWADEHVVVERMVAPIWGDKEAVEDAVAYALKWGWRLSIQVHKVVGVE